MSFSSLLSELKGKPTTNYDSKLTGLSLNKPNGSKKNQVARSSALSLSKSESKKLVYRRPTPFNGGLNEVDPAVARLKAARQKEKEELMLKKNKEKREKLIRMGINPDEIEKPTKKNKPTAARGAEAKSRNRSSTTTAKRTIISRKKYSDDNKDISAFPKKKMKFSELMKQAEKVDISSTVNNGFTYDKQKKPIDSRFKKPLESRISKKPTGRNLMTASKRNPSDLAKQKRYSATKVSREKPSTGERLLNKKNPRISGEDSTHSVLERNLKTENRRTVGFRGPSEKLKKKLDARKKMEKTRNYYDEDSYDDEDDDFIVHDEEQDYNDDEADTGYDRNEIWNIFNRGKKARSYDYDDYDDESDMEATGDQVFDEEDYSNRQALLEEKREKQLEKEHYRQKMKRLSRG